MCHNGLLRNFNAKHSPLAHDSCNELNAKHSPLAHDSCNELNAKHNAHLRWSVIF